MVNLQVYVEDQYTGIPIANAYMSLYQGGVQRYSTYTSPTGFGTFTNIIYPMIYTLKVTKTGYNDFTTTVDAQQGAIYVTLVPIESPPPTTYRLEVTVKDIDTDALIPGVSVRLAGGTDYIVNTGNNGKAIFATILDGTYTLTATKTGYLTVTASGISASQVDVLVLMKSLTSPPPQPGDKYYQCVSEKCTQVTGTFGYKNDPTCQGKCTPDEDGNDTIIYVSAATIILVGGYLILKKKVK